MAIVLPAPPLVQRRRELMALLERIKARGVVKSVRYAARITRVEDLFGPGGAAPCLVLSWGDSKFTSRSMGGSLQYHDASWAVFLVVGSLASEEARAEGTAGENAEAGWMPLVEFVRAVLQSKRIGDFPLALKSVALIVQAPTVNVYAFTIQTRHEERATGSRELADLLEIDGDINLVGEPDDPSNPRNQGRVTFP